MRRPALQQLCSPEFGCMVEGQEADTRIIALGSAALTEGFSLIGCETLPDATEEELEELLSELDRQGRKALVLIEEYLARSEGDMLQRLRNEGGRIVITELPPLNAPDDFRPGVEELVLAVLGPSALEEN